MKKVIDTVVQKELFDLVKLIDRARKLPYFACMAIIGVSTSTALAGSEAIEWSKDPATLCEFVAPESLTKGPTFWTGACVNGKASGTGMLRRRDGNRGGPAFFGQMKNGLPQLGVIDLGSGYRINTSRDSDIRASAETEPQIRIDAFRVAADAARQIGAKYAAEKNTASAQYYNTIAKTLELQIE